MSQLLFLMVNEIHFALKLFDTEMPVLYKVDLLWKPDASHDQVKTVKYSIFSPLIWPEKLFLSTRLGLAYSFVVGNLST